MGDDLTKEGHANMKNKTRGRTYGQIFSVADLVSKNCLNLWGIFLLNIRCRK